MANLAATSSTVARKTLLSPVARLRLRKFTALSACANSQPSAMEETTIIGYGVLLAVLLFAACGYYCWSESQKSAMVAEALRVAAERRKGAVAPAEDDGDEEEAAGATAKGWSRVGQQPGGGGKKKSRWGRRRPSLEPIAGSSDDDVERGQPRRGRRGAPAGSSAGLMDSDDDDSPNRSKPARGGRAKPKRGGARMSEEERCRRLGTPSPDLE